MSTMPSDSTPEAWLADLDDDDAAPRMIVSALDETTPVPEWMTRAANIAWAARDLDAELAELVGNEGLVRAVRGAQSSVDAPLLFATSVAEISVHPMPVDGSFELDIMVRWLLSDGSDRSPDRSLEETKCSVESVGKSVPAVDEGAGLYTAATDGGLTRIRLLVGTLVLLTPWFRL